MGFWDNFSSSLPGVGAAAGGWFNYKGQKATNQANRDIAQMTNQANRDIADMTNVANAKQAQQQMDFMERMSGSAFQRQMADMRQAGINPMLAASLGGASTPPGASIPAVTGAGAVTGAPMQNEMSGVGSAVNSAMDAVRLKFEVKNMDQTLKNLRETNKKISSDTALNAALTNTAREDAILKRNSAANVRTVNESMKLDQVGKAAEAAIDQTKFGQTMRIFGRLNPLNTMSSATKNVANVLR